MSDARRGPEDNGIPALLDPGTACELDLPGAQSCVALRVLTGSVHGRPVVIAGIDAGEKRGAIGVVEAGALAAVFQELSTRPAPLVLHLDSSGARMDMGLPMLGAFRELLACALRAVAGGVHMIAILRSICFGGASMLAYLAQRRILTGSSRIAMSGPAVIAAVAGKDALDPGDACDVEALIGGAARAQLNGTDRLCAADAAALRLALADCVDELEQAKENGIAASHRVLFERLGRLGIEIARSPKPSPPQLKRRMDALLPEGFETVLGAGVVRGVRMHAGREITITGIVQGAPLTAAASWMLAESIITSARTRPERPIVILCDSPGHAMTRADEAALLSQYLAHLARTVQWATEQGIIVSVWILGEASGAGYVALTAASRFVLALAGAHIRVLPQEALASVIAAAPAADGGPQRWLELGLVDSVLQADVLKEDDVRAAGLGAG